MPAIAKHVFKPLAYFACPVCRKQLVRTNQYSDKLVCRHCQKDWPIIEGVYVLGDMKLPEIVQELQGIKTLDRRHQQDPDDQAFQNALLVLPNLLPNSPLTKPDSYFWDVHIGKRAFDEFSHRLGKPPLAILELGADWCWASSRLAELGHQVFALDINRTHLINAARLMPNRGEFVRLQADMNHLPFRDHSLDLVVGIASVHHTTNLAHTLQEITRVLRPDGQVVLLREPVRGEKVAAEAFGREEKTHGIHETAPTLKEWLTAFHQTGLSPSAAIAQLDFRAGTWSPRTQLRALKRIILNLPVLGPILLPYTITDYHFRATKPGIPLADKPQSI